MSINATHVWKPSSSRIVTIDSFVPVPRGMGATTPSLLTWAAKDPKDVLDYQLDIGPALTGDEGDTIATIDVSISPSEAGDLVATSIAADGTRVVLWLAGGQAGVVYAVTIEVTTANGRRLQRGILLPVLSLASAGALANAIEVLPGVMLTDHYGNPVLTLP